MEDISAICNCTMQGRKNPKAKSEILKQLNILGISEKFIYPGLEGIGKTIVKKYSDSSDK